MAEPKNGRPIFFPENLVIFGNLALFVWIVLDTVAFLLFDITIWHRFFHNSANRNLWCTALHRVPASMLQLHKMHSRHGTPGSIILWQTHLQRLQIQLQTAHSNILHSIYRGVSSSIRALLRGHGFHGHQSSGFCGSFGIYNLQRLNVANKKGEHTGCLITSPAKINYFLTPLTLPTKVFQKFSPIEGRAAFWILPYQPYKK